MVNETVRFQNKPDFLKQKSATSRITVSKYDWKTSATHLVSLRSHKLVQEFKLTYLPEQQIIGCLTQRGSLSE